MASQARRPSAIDDAPYPSFINRGRCVTHPNPYADFMTEANNSLRLKTAQEMCAICPVLRECIEWAALIPTNLGYWGSSELARRDLRAGRTTLDRLVDRAQRKGANTRA